VSDVPWAAVRTLARRELRRRWRAVLALGLAAAALAAGVAAVATVQWRTDSAYPRLVQRSGLEDVRVSLIPQFAAAGDEAAAVRATAANATRLAADAPVTQARRVDQFLGRLRRPGVQYAAVSAPASSAGRVGVPVLVRGRAPDPAAVKPPS